MSWWEWVVFAILTALSLRMAYGFGRFLLIWQRIRNHTAWTNRLLSDDVIRAAARAHHDVRCCDDNGVGLRDIREVRAALAAAAEAME